MLASRLSGVVLNAIIGGLLFLAVVWMGGGGRAGLLAVVILGALPAHFGWFRMDSHEALLTVLTLLTLIALMRPLSSRWLGVQLGLLAGLGFCAKTAYPIFVIVPGLLWVLVHLRRPRLWLHLGLAAAVALALLGPWLLNTMDQLAEYVQAASNPDEFPLLDKAMTYFTFFPGTPLLLLAGVSGALLAARLRVASLFKVGLLFSSAMSGLAILILAFDPWRRYMVPAFPSLAILAALGLEGVLRRVEGRWSPRITNAMAGALAVCLLGLYVNYNLVGVPWPEDQREWGAGMVSPDQRSYEAFPKVVARARKEKVPLVLVHGWPQEMNLRPENLTGIWFARGWGGPFVDQFAAMETLKRGGRLLVLFSHLGDPRDVSTMDLLKHNRPTDDVGPAFYRMLLASSPRVLHSRTDPDQNTYALIEAVGVGGGGAGSP